MSQDDFPAPESGLVLTHFLVVSDQIGASYAEWSAHGAQFHTEPKDHGSEIRAYIRDPDGRLIEVGQATGLVS